ncbi:molybdopterin-dependent oxidoreductase [Methylomonas sp. SURF-2]|uniref:Molybdopterin-dependent oxidoreductase n=1 Tax=Methylomonas subterranea TaxID=2952225 RepID=A0ABT1TIP6_9GAMM|nr:nitrate reductase [Methylomonas sp. SURF-2]MCQ8105108.1 molybdopterin-dependent oxidoreductase [Methylomonas sp. SURF-2]
MSPTSIKTTCPYCGVGCGIEATLIDPENHIVDIKGDAQHPANFGRLCSKGATLGDTVSLENRLLQPEIDGQTVDWDSALTHVARRFSAIVAEHGPDAVAFYVSGQLLTEDYYVANKLMKGFIGSANIDTNSRLCMSSAVVGYKRAFGADAVPCNYEDLEQAELIVLVGSNTAWCHPVAFQRIRRAKESNPALKIVVIDPRATSTCDIADLHLSIRPGMDALLFNGLLTYLAETESLDRDFIDRHCQDFVPTLLAARASAFDLDEVAAGCGVTAHDVAQLFAWFANHKKVVTVYSQGINQSGSGSDKCNAIINCHLASGKIGKPGCGPFSLTGQPNAMGGREVGGLANMLAAHMDLENPRHVDRVGRFWGSDKVANRQGLKAVELFDAVAEGRVKAVWIMATNPVVSMPDADKVKRALQQCELVVVSDCIANTDTMALAHVKLPATGWSEKDGTVTNLERRISRQRPLFPPSGQARPDWWIISQVARRMGFAGFDYQASADIFREHAALSGFENDSMHGVRAFDISAFADIDQVRFDALQPVQWPVTAKATQGTARLFGDGGFYTPHGRASFVPIVPRGPVHAADAAYQFTLNTGRLRDQWHTMTRTALAAKLNSHKPEPTVEIHPADALQLGFRQQGLARLTSRWGSMLARVDITVSQQPGSVFVPMHWTEQLSSRGRVGALVNPVVDPLSGQPESKQTPVRVEAWQPRWQALLLSRQPARIEGVEYQVKVKGDGYWRYHLAGRDALDDLPGWCRARLNIGSAEMAECLEYSDAAAGDYRLARVEAGQLSACLFVTAQAELPEPGWLCGLFGKTELSRKERLSLLSGLPPRGEQDVGRTVCSCFNVGEKTILQTIAEHKLDSVAGIGACLSAGTGCGSCLPELKTLLADAGKAALEQCSTPKSG